MSTRTTIVIVALVVASVFVQAQAPGSPRPGPAAKSITQGPQTGSARIRGRVTGLPSGAVLPRARVVAIPADDRRPRNEPRSAITDANGRYEIGGLPAGRYRVVAEKAGYVRSGSDRRNPSPAIDVADRATIERPAMVRALLEDRLLSDRFRLDVRRETREFR